MRLRSMDGAMALLLRGSARKLSAPPVSPPRSASPTLPEGGSRRARLPAVKEPTDWERPRWNKRTAFSAFVHLMHSAAILVLTLFVRAPAGPVLRYAWGVGAFFSVITLLVLLRVG